MLRTDGRSVVLKELGVLIKWFLCVLLNSERSKMSVRSAKRLAKSVSRIDEKEKENKFFWQKKLTFQIKKEEIAEFCSKAEFFLASTEKVSY
jgi:hypothetical protein